ncbi:DUF3040 domain-containing protein [Streptomyces bullii]|uniref:DUF3040 domain-containing protein n=1 Tax=Streptomyces bullii TaxID=349910 RepID=A0ABW0UZ45_9ACTN
MDDRRILAELEQRLQRDDPELARLMDALNRQFPDQQKNTDTSDDDSGRRFDWRWKAAIACVVVAVLGLLLTSIFTATPSTGDDHEPPNSRLPAVSAHTQRRAPGSGSSRRAKPARQGRGTTERPTGEPHART